MYECLLKVVEGIGVQRVELAIALLCSNKRHLMWVAYVCMGAYKNNIGMLIFTRCLFVISVKYHNTSLYKMCTNLFREMGCVRINKDLYKVFGKEKHMKVEG